MARDVGLIGAGPDDENPAAAMVNSFSIDPGARGRDIAHLLSQAADSRAGRNGYRAVRLRVADDNTVAIRLYERRGYLRTGETERFPPPREDLMGHARQLDLD